MIDILGFRVSSTIIDTGFILLGFVVTLRLLNYILNKFYKKYNEIYWRYLGNILKAFVCFMFISLLGAQFSLTSQISVELFKSTGLIVAVLGFAAQEVLKDILAGMMISISKPYNIGSRINISNLDITGIVEDITLRHTVIKCFDNSRVIVPNSVINRDVLKNTDYDDSLIGNYLEIGISYDSDIRLAVDILKKVVLGHDLVVDSSKGNCDKTCSVLVKELGEYAIVLKTTVWTKTVDDNFNACSDIRISVKEEFDKAGIVIPYPCRTIDFSKDARTLLEGLELRASEDSVKDLVKEDKGEVKDSSDVGL